MPVRYSIIIPTLNEEKFLPKLLASLAAQTDRNFEVIVVDGSSKDKTVAVAKSFAKRLPKLEVIVSKIASLPLQRNLGAKAASGEWYVFADADGVFMPYFINRCAYFIETTATHVFTTWFLPDSNNPKDGVYTLLLNMYVEATLIFKRPLSPGPLTIVHSDVFTAVGGYDEKHEYHEDVDFGLRLFKQGYRVDVFPEALCIWSLRRFRREGLIKVLNQYVISSLPIFFFNTSMKHMPGYTMGGQLYQKRKKGVTKSTIQRFEHSLKTLLKEVFE